MNIPKFMKFTLNEKRAYQIICTPKIIDLHPNISRLNFVLLKLVVHTTNMEDPTHYIDMIELSCVFTTKLPTVYILKNSVPT